MLKNNKIFLLRQYYLNLLQYGIKKGQKYKIEKIIYKSLFFQNKLNKRLNYKKRFYNIYFLKTFLNTTPFIKVNIKRKGSRNIYIPKPLKKKQKRAFSSRWIYQNKNIKSKFYLGLLDELKKSALKISISTKKRNELHKLAFANLKDVKERLKFNIKKKIKK